METQRRRRLNLEFATVVESFAGRNAAWPAGTRKRLAVSVILCCGYTLTNK